MYFIFIDICCVFYLKNLLIFLFLALPAPPEELANNYFNLAPTPLVPAPPMPPYPPPVAMLRGPPPIGMFWINLYYCVAKVYSFI